MVFISCILETDCTKKGYWILDITKKLLKFHHKDVGIEFEVKYCENAGCS